MLKIALFSTAYIALLVPTLGFAQPTFQNIQIEAPEPYASRVLELLEEAGSTKVGGKLLEEIQSRQHTLTIRHAPGSLHSAGRTLTPLTRKISNGEGDNVLLEMHFGLPVMGSHEVLNCKGGGRTPFTALLNFVHELRHARDAITGQFRGHRSERDAVESENELRLELQIQDRRCLSDEIEHTWQIWFPIFQTPAGL